MSNYEFDSVIPEKYDGTPSGKDVLAKKIGLIDKIIGCDCDGV